MNKRPLKFRMWDEESKTMIDADSLAFEEYAPISVLLTNRPNIMQYTGLQDKNGKEIYEGDIVTYEDGNEWSTESGYDCEEFMNTGVINFDTEYARYDVTNKESADYEELFEGGGDFEVIGNIYENPELLEEE